MKVTIDVPEFLLALITGWSPPGDDDAEVIGDSRVAYISKRDPAHVFLDVAKWHDAAYEKGSRFQQHWSRYEVDARFLHTMLIWSKGDFELERDAVTLYLLARKFGAKMWEGQQ